MYSFESRIRFSEVNENNELDLSSIINYFQDCCMFHSEDVGFGLRYRDISGTTWVLSSWNIIVTRYPRLFEKIKITTYPYKVNNFLGFRNFVITTEDGETCAVADSCWINISLETGKPARATKEEVKAYQISDRIEMEDAKGKIRVPDNAESKEAFDVVPSNIDSNHHVNNGQYVKMAETFLPKDFHIRKLRVEYRNAAKLGDVIYPRISHQNDSFLVSLEDETIKPYAIIEFIS